TCLPDIRRAEMPSAHLCRHEYVLPADLLDRSAHHFFRVAFSIRLGGVDQVDPQVNRPFHRLLTIGIPHIGAPGLAARLPHADSDRGHLRAPATELDVVHRI